MGLALKKKNGTKNTLKINKYMVSVMFRAAYTLYFTGNDILLILNVLIYYNSYVFNLERLK